MHANVKHVQLQTPIIKCDEPENQFSVLTNPTKPIGNYRDFEPLTSDTYMATIAGCV